MLKLKYLSKLSIYFLLIVSLAGFSFADCTSLNDALTYYSLDDKEDNTGNYNTINSGVTFSDTDSILGNAGVFDGNSYIETGYTGESYSDGWSVSFWTRSNQTAGFMPYGVQHDTTYYVNTYVLQGIADLSGRQYEYGNNDGYITWGYTGTMSTDTWYHFVITKGDNIHSNYSLYLDGSLISSKTPVGVASTSWSTNFPWYIGSANSKNVSLQKPTVGLIDEIGFWDKELTSTEVSNLYNSGNGCNPYASEENVTETLLTLSTNLTDTNNFNNEIFSVSYNGTFSGYDGLFDCFIKNETHVLNASFNTNLSINNYFHLPLEETGNYSLNIFCEGFTEYNVTSIETLTGTVNSGNLNSILEIDTNYYEVQEVGGTPGFEIIINGTNFLDITQIFLNSNYDGNPAHTVNFQILNWTSGSYQTVHTIESSPDFVFDIFNISNSSDFINGGDASARFYHSSSGNPSHVFYLDYLSAVSSNITDNTATYILNYDLIPPDLVISSNFINNSQYYDSVDLTYNVTIFDLNLYAYNHTIIDNDNDIKRNDFLTGINVSTYILNITNSTESFGINNYTIIIEAWDSHTTKELNYEIIKNSDYEMEYNGILIYSDNKIKEEKKKDKYIFEIDKKSTLCYKTTNEFIKIENSEYNSHYIDFINNVWIDELNYNFEERFFNGKLQELCFYNEKDNSYKTESIGDLNYKILKYYFSIIATPDLNSQLLSDINQTLFNINNDTIDIQEGIAMIGLIIFALVFIIIGFFTRFRLGFSVSGVIIGILSLMNGEAWLSSAGSDLTDKALFFSFLFMGVIFVILGFALQIMEIMSDSEGNKKKGSGMYDIY